MPIPNQASWVTKKILSMRKHMNAIGSWDSVTHNGKCSINKVYLALRGEVMNVPRKALNSSNPAPPRATFITWLALLGKLRTRDMLFSWNYVLKDKCVFCSTCSESAPHLLFACRFSYSIWRGILDWLKWDRQILSWDNEWLWVTKASRGKSAAWVSEPALH